METIQHESVTNRETALLLKKKAELELANVGQTPTVRDQVAMTILSALVSKYGLDCLANGEAVRISISAADAFLKERSK